MQGRIISKDFNISSYKNSKKFKKLNFSIEEKKEDNLKKHLINISKEKILETKKKGYKFFLVSRMKKKDRFFLYPVYMKFLNRLMRKGYKNRYLTFFYKMLRAHKKRVFFYFNKNLTQNNLLKKTLPSFPLVFGIVFRFITLKVELKLKKMKKREVMTPSPMSPWRGWRTGLNILFINAKTRLEKIKRSRKVDFLYSILDEVWLTFQGNSATTKNILEFTNNVLENSQNYRDTELFPMRADRRELVSIKPLLKLKTKVVVFKQEKKKKKKNRYSLLSKFLKVRGNNLNYFHYNLSRNAPRTKRQKQKFFRSYFSSKISNIALIERHKGFLLKQIKYHKYKFHKYRFKTRQNKNEVKLKRGRDYIKYLQKLLKNKLPRPQGFITRPKLLINKFKKEQLKVKDLNIYNNKFKKLKKIKLNKMKLYEKKKTLYKFNLIKFNNNYVIYKYKKFLVYGNFYRRTNKFERKEQRKEQRKERLKHV